MRKRLSSMVCAAALFAIMVFAASMFNAALSSPVSAASLTLTHTQFVCGRYHPYCEPWGAALS